MKDAGFGGLVQLAQSANLASHLKIELVKIQYQEPFDPKPYLLDELILRLDGDGKLNQLPEKAFERIMNYRAKQLKLVETDVKILEKIEKKETLSEEEKMQLHIKLGNNQQAIEALPQACRAVIRDKINSTHSTIQEFLRLLKDVNLSPAIADNMIDYVKLLEDIEVKNHTPHESELAKLDLLHDELVRHHKLDALPNRVQAFLENHQTEQKIKQNTPAQQHIAQIMQRARDEQPLELMEAVELNIYLTEYGNIIPHDINRQIRNYLARQYQDIYQTARTQFVDGKALNMINQVIDQIAEEQRAGKDGKKIYIPEINAHIQLTSNFMEIRLVDGIKDIITDDNLKILLTNPDAVQFDNNTSFIRYHEGLDFSGFDHHGQVTYQYGLGNIQGTYTGIAPETAKILSITNSTTDGRATKDVTIFEYHPKHGILLTTFRHMQTVAVSAGTTLQANDAIGSYSITSGKKKGNNEHVHIERRHADVNAVQQFGIETLQNEWIAYLNISDDHLKAKAKQEMSQKLPLIQPIMEGNDYQTMALFNPGSPLNRQFIQDAEQKWLKNAQRFIKIRELTDPKKVKALIRELNHATYRDQLMLKTIVEMLLKIKILLAQVGERNDGLERTIQKAQQATIDLREDFLPEAIRITL